MVRVVPQTQACARSRAKGPYSPHAASSLRLGFYIARLRRWTICVHRRSIPHIPLINRHTILLADAAELGLEILFFVMLGLVADVLADGFGVGIADAEFAVSALPCEVAIPRAFRFDPFRRARFHMLDDFARDVVFRLGKQHVNVVIDRVDLDQRTIVVVQDAGDVCVKFAPLFIAEQRSSAFGAEDDVNRNDEQGLAHDALVLMVWIVDVLGRRP